jgi:hypothetical protein
MRSKVLSFKSIEASFLSTWAEAIV